MNAIKDKGVVNRQVLVDQQLDALLGGHASHVGTHVVDLGVPEAKNLAQVLFLQRLLLDRSSDFVALCSHQRILIILVNVVGSRLVSLSNEIFESTHDD